MINSTKLEYSQNDHTKWEKHISIGQWLNSFLEPEQEQQRLLHIANTDLARSVGDRLSVNQIDEICNYLTQVKDLKLRREYFNGRPLNKTLSGLIVPLVESVLDKDNAITSVLNIGAYYSFTDHSLAIKYPKTQFTAIDLLPDMAKYNAEFELSNLNFIAGYALEKLEKKEVCSDITLFSATAAEIMNVELRNYFKLLSNQTKYVILSEPIYPLPKSQVINPDLVGLSNSIPAYAQPSYLPHRIGPVAYVHNYRHMLEEHGFKILHYHVFRPSFTDLTWVHCIAKKD